MKRRALLIVNPRSRSGADHAENASKILEAAGLSVVRPNADDPSKYEEIVRGHRSEVDLVIVGGGDGSVNLALPGLLGGDLPLGVLPLGTANNFARNLNLPINLEAACKVIAAGHTRKVDVASVNGKYFLNVSGMGISTEINRTIPREMKRRFGVLAYIVHAYVVARRTRPFRVEITIDDDAPISVKTLQITVCNGQHYGPGMKITADAKIDDGRLDLCSTEVESWWRALPLIPSLIRGTPEREDALRWRSGSRIHLKTKKHYWIDADGEMVTRAPAEYRIHPQRLTVFA